MTLSGETRITKRVEKLMIDPFYAILFGFIPADYLNTHSDANPDDIPTDILPGVGISTTLWTGLSAEMECFTGPIFISAGASPKVN